MVKYFIRQDNYSMHNVDFNTLRELCKFISETVLNEYTANYYKPKIRRNEVVFEKVEPYNLKESVEMIKSCIEIFISTHTPVLGAGIIFELNVFMRNDGRIGCNIYSDSTVEDALWCQKCNIGIIDVEDDVKNG